ncbi:MAG: hypothetical protein QOJ70_1558 [Acidobacteriota bacterium]|nr:hypothetical protein [Acidobacteriota bacterium]
MSRKLSEPILDSGINTSNFFNGRLLTADALKTDQQAGREQRRLLGRAVGNGVVEGLEVTVVSAGGVGSQPTVAVSKGLALNRSGQVLQLNGDEQIALVRKLDAPPADAGAFADCADAVSTFDTLENGVYVLVIGPASGFRERVPMRGLSDTAAVNECGSRFVVEGVQFRLARLDLAAMSEPSMSMGLSAATLAQINTLMSATSAVELSKLRNLLAHVCFGTEEVAKIPREPFRQQQGQLAFESYGAADFLRTKGQLTDCEVPLALVYWRGGTLRFADSWAVRRRVRARAGGALSYLFAPRRVAEAEAVLFQFEEHLLWLFGSQTNPESFVATELFRWLPAAALVPLRSSTNTAGVSVEKFFLNKSFGPPALLKGARLRALINESLDYPPVDLTAPDYVQLYTVKENSQAQNAPAAPRPFVVFATQEMPHHSEQPRFAALCETLKQTRQTYRDLVNKNVFLRTITTPQALTARLSVTGVLQASMNTAGERFVAACRCDCVASHEKGLALMQDLYDAQASMVKVMLTDWGKIELGSMKDYASLVAGHLDVAISGGRSSLKAALNAKDLKAALDAQNAINAIGLKWAGAISIVSLDERTTFEVAEATVRSKAIAVEEEATAVVFLGEPDIEGDPVAAHVGADLVYTFRSRFHAAEDALTRDFRFFVVYLSPANASSLYAITFGNKTAESDAALSNAKQQVTRPYPMTSDAVDEIVVNIKPSGGAIGHPFTFKVRVQSVRDSNLSCESENITVTAVKA